MYSLSVLRKPRPSAGRGVDELKFGLDDVFHRAERLEMLFPDGGENAVPGMDQITDFPDVAGAFSAHLGDQDLMGRPERLPDGAHHSQGGVVTLGGHQDIVFDRKQRMEEILGAGFPITAGDTDRQKPRHGLEPPPGVLHIPVREGLFQRTEQEIRHQGPDPDHQGIERRHADAPHPVDEKGAGEDQEQKQRLHAEQAPDAVGEDQRLFGLFGYVETGGQKQHGPGGVIGIDAGQPHDRQQQGGQQPAKVDHLLLVILAPLRYRSFR